MAENAPDVKPCPHCAHPDPSVADALVALGAATCWHNNTPGVAPTEAPSERQIVRLALKHRLIGTNEADRENLLAFARELVATSGVALVTPAQPLYRFLTGADTIEASDEFVDDDCVRWNPPDRWSIGESYHSAFKTARRRLADGVPEVPRG